jgi:hypothetical protein
MVYRMPYAIRGPVLALENCQWCGEPCFAGAGAGYSETQVFIYEAAQRNVPEGIDFHLSVIVRYWKFIISR